MGGWADGEGRAYPLNIFGLANFWLSRAAFSLVELYGSHWFQGEGVEKGVEIDGPIGA